MPPLPILECSRMFSQPQEETLHLLGFPCSCAAGLHHVHGILWLVCIELQSFLSCSGVHPQVSSKTSEHPVHRLLMHHLLMDTSIPSHCLRKGRDPPIPRVRICQCRPLGRMASWAEVQASIRWPGAPSGAPSSHVCSLTKGQEYWVLEMPPPGLQ